MVVAQRTLDAQINTFAIDGRQVFLEVLDPVRSDHLAIIGADQLGVLRKYLCVGMGKRIRSRYADESGPLPIDKEVTPFNILGRNRIGGTVNHGPEELLALQHVVV